MALAALFKSASVGVCAAALFGCGGAGVDQAEIDRELLRALPPMPVFAQVGVIGCSEADDRTECRGCEVIAFGPDRADGLVEARVSEYSLRLDEEGALRLSSHGGDHPRQEFDVDGNLESARTMIASATTWCESQGATRWLVDRDELTEAYEGDA